MSGVITSVKLLKRACHICHSIKITLVKDRHMSEASSGFLPVDAMPLLPTAALLLWRCAPSLQQHLCSDVKQLIILEFEKLHQCSGVQGIVQCISFNIHTWHHIQNEGAKETKFPSLEKECSAILNFIKKIQVQKKQGMKIVFSFWHSN